MSGGVQSTQNRLGIPEGALRLLSVVLILAIAFLALRIGTAFLHHLASRRFGQTRTERYRTLHALIANVFRVIVLFFTLTSILGVFGINTASVLTAAGIGGIAVAFGAQTLVSDVIFGALFLIDNSFNVGDYIALKDGIIGTVKDMRLRHVIVHGYTGMDYIVPNSEVKIVANYGRGPMQVDVALNVPYTVRIADAHHLVDQISARAEKEAAEEFIRFPYFVGVDAVERFSYRLTIGATADMAHFFSAPRRLREIALEELEAAGAFHALEDPCSAEGSRYGQV